MNSPFPTSFNGNGFLFGADLFSLLLMTSLSLMIGVVFCQQLWHDRKEPIGPAWAFCALFLAICTSTVIIWVPEIVYNVAYAEADQTLRDTLQNVKRICHVISLFPFIYYFAMLWVWRIEIILKLKAPSAKVWDDHRAGRLKQLIAVGGVCCVFATSVAIGRTFS